MHVYGLVLDAVSESVHSWNLSTKTKEHKKIGLAEGLILFLLSA